MVTRSQKEPKLKNPVLDDYTSPEYEYFEGLPPKQKNIIANAEAHVRNLKREDMPLRFRLLLSDMPDPVKAMAIKKCTSLAYAYPGSGESSKLTTWLDTLSAIPFGPPPPSVLMKCGPSKALQQVRECLDQAVNGHDEVKREIVHFVAQRIVNPTARGRVLCLSGPPGVAKTHLARQGISKALGLPFTTIALGGANDGSWLCGHNYTYETSQPGIIVQELIKAGRKDLVLLMDEIDKISQQRGGDEITNTLMHITDPSQNDVFRDKYFAEVPIDLSHAFIVCSCNDPELINPILRDRLTIVRMQGYPASTKVSIFRSHLLQEACGQFGLQPQSVAIEDSTVRYIVEQIAEEDGVRGLKKAIHSILSELVTRRLLAADDTACINNDDAFTIDNLVVDELLSDSYKKNAGKGVPGMMYT